MTDYYVLVFRNRVVAVDTDLEALRAKARPLADAHLGGRPAFVQDERAWFYREGGGEHAFLYIATIDDDRYTTELEFECEFAARAERDAAQERRDMGRQGDKL